MITTVLVLAYRVNRVLMLVVMTARNRLRLRQRSSGFLWVSMTWPHVRVKHFWGPPAQTNLLVLRRGDFLLDADQKRSELQG